MRRPPMEQGKQSIRDCNKTGVDRDIMMERIFARQDAETSDHRLERRIIARYVGFGIFLGLGIPLIAWWLDAFLSHLPLGLQTLWRLHQTNPLHWIIDTALAVLGVTCTSIDM